MGLSSFIIHVVWDEAQRKRDEDEDEMNKLKKERGMEDKGEGREKRGMKRRKTLTNWRMEAEWKTEVRGEKKREMGNGEE
ncbi:hypothetical protein Pcinc_019819 [Petrolisthes cinctipes]|uniref:Uncharacterized protein n=1 Tax=Petrolisthes cinctipes TaxID=88211 RepID=A0AAE1KL09_PETCI|nr:hypothetical protein Pcinc_019819 [Petrolisthes cinctipes]